MMYYSTRQLAQFLGVPTRYIYEEVTLSRRLSAHVTPRQASLGRQKGHAAIRIYPHQVDAYIATYWPERLTDWQRIRLADQHSAA